MTETTTIQVRKDQAERLKEIARQNGNYKTAIDRVLEGYNENKSEGTQSETLENLQQQLDRIESAQSGTVDKAMSLSDEINESEIARNVSADLKAELPALIAEELQR